MSTFDDGYRHGVRETERAKSGIPDFEARDARRERNERILWQTLMVCIALVLIAVVTGVVVGNAIGGPSSNQRDLACIRAGGTLVNDDNPICIGARP